MTWTIEFDSDVEKDLKKLGHTAQKRILQYLKEKIMPAENPRVFGKALSGNLEGIWRDRQKMKNLIYHKLPIFLIFNTQ